MKYKYRVGYVDEDSTQVKIFTTALKEHNIEVVGYDIQQGMLEDEILDLVYDSSIDLVMFDYYLKDKGILTFNGDELERRFREIKPRFPIIIFTSNENDAFDDVDDPNIIYNKDMVLEEGKVERFVQMLSKNVENYRTYIDKRKVLISSLLLKGEEKGLNASEKDTLLSTQLELGALDKKSKKEIPLQLLSEEKLNEISKIKKDAEQFLQSLINKKK
ncbi:hypothetical protein [Tenacibaculum insulae]|uniref:hypothetical protein n=1 Tax=Tenacibaculum insulae TaxID=2029677 RepID=UPI003AB28776